MRLPGTTGRSVASPSVATFVGVFRVAWSARSGRLRGSGEGLPLRRFVPDTAVVRAEPGEDSPERDRRRERIYPMSVD
ncbi:hypothetical protein NOCA270084 [metagenome]|uniref:Uncharacterized protein n=1 Tax=metagenome TaxID=256318 RepID=A0A2P2CDQ2_9ZZZZ